MGLFDKFNKLKNIIDTIEDSIDNSRLDFMEVYEKNIKLQEEIKERTEELELANQRLLTVQHIWEMMNSAQPLHNVLDSIVNSIQGELGYLFSCIMQKKVDNKGDYVDMLATSKCGLTDDIRNIMGVSLFETRLNWIHHEDIVYHINNNKIYQSTEISYALSLLFPNLNKNMVKEVCSRTNLASFITIPLLSNGSHFGSLVVFSSRKVATDAEINFLKLFAKQIELAITIANLFQTVKEQAISDGLTGLKNRRYFEEEAQKEILRAQRQNQKFSIIGLDLDHLKQINDNFGHSCGDIAIKAVAEVLKKNARSIDIAARMGGEEFNILLPGVDSDGGVIAAERIRKAIEGLDIEVIGHVTASVGVATYGVHSTNLNELFELTDQAMYTSKKNGRNKVTVANPEDMDSWQDIAIDSFVQILKNKNIPIEKPLLKGLKSELSDYSEKQDAIYTVSDTLISLYNPNYTKGLTKQKVLAANLMAKRFELAKEETDKLKVAILLYDIGNMMLPKNLLQKAQPLSDDELRTIHTHPVIAAKEILSPISIVHDVIPIIEHHHENWDGSGYPGNISGQEIPLCSQIVLIIDSYFALIEPRPYRDALSKQDALNMIRNDIGKKWNSKIAEEFISIITSNDNF